MNYYIPFNNGHKSKMVKQKWRGGTRKLKIKLLPVIHPKADPNKHCQIPLLPACYHNWSCWWLSVIPSRRRFAMSAASFLALSYKINHKLILTDRFLLACKLNAVTLHHLISASGQKSLKKLESTKISWKSNEIVVSLPSFTKLPKKTLKIDFNI